MQDQVFRPKTNIVGNKEEYDFQPLGFEIIHTDSKKVEAVAAVFDRKTGLFRTKILVFRRELTDDDI